MKLSNKHRRALEYLVEWKIDIDADNSVDAAKQAKRIHLDPESTATVFQVTDTKTSHTSQVNYPRLKTRGMSREGCEQLVDKEALKNAEVRRKKYIHTHRYYAS